jgi:hypothetical protein
LCPETEATLLRRRRDGSSSAFHQVVVVGAPTDTAHARNQAAGRALGRALYEQHADIDGICYQSRLTGGYCLAIFDRALQNLTPIKTGELEHHPELPNALRKHHVRIEQ